MNSWVLALIADLIKALFEGALELVGCLGITITMEDTPGVQSWLSEHFGLDFSVKLTSTLLNVERVWSSACSCAHHQVTSFVLVAVEASWLFAELQVPLLLLLLALFVLAEGVEESFAFLDLSVSVGVDNLGKILHQSEISTHSVGQPCQLAKFRDQCDFISSLTVLVDEERLVWIFDALVVPGLVVLGVAHLLAILVESGGWAHAEVNALHTVGFLVVPGDNGCSSKSCLYGLLPVSSTTLACFLSQLGDVVEN